MSRLSRKFHRTFAAVVRLRHTAAVAAVVGAAFAALAPSALASGNYVYHDWSQDPGWGGQAPLTWIESQGSDVYALFQTSTSAGSCTGASPDKSLSHWLYNAYVCSPNNNGQTVMVYEGHNWGWPFVGKQAGNGGFLIVYYLWGWESW